MKFIARIRRNSDGRIAEFRGDQPLEWMPNAEDGFFIWEEGNYACDCNRAAFFSHAIGEDSPHPVDLPCGNTRYTVLDITFENGDVYYPDGKVEG